MQRASVYILHRVATFGTSQLGEKLATRQRERRPDWSVASPVQCSVALHYCCPGIQQEEITAEKYSPGCVSVFVLLIMFIMIRQKPVGGAVAERGD